MAAYLEKAKTALEHFEFYTIEQVPQEQNLNADALARLATSTEVDALMLCQSSICRHPVLASLNRKMST